MRLGLYLYILQVLLFSQASCLAFDFYPQPCSIRQMDVHNVS